MPPRASGSITIAPRARSAVGSKGGSMRSSRLVLVPSVFALLVGFALAPRPASAVIIDNDLVPPTLGSWSVDVLTGGQTNTATLTANRLASADVQTSDIIFDYFS